jgi:hypothetical protein
VSYGGVEQAFYACGKVSKSWALAPEVRYFLASYFLDAIGDYPK